MDVFEAITKIFLSSLWFVALTMLTMQVVPSQSFLSDVAAWVCVMSVFVALFTSLTLIWIR